MVVDCDVCGALEFAHHLVEIDDLDALARRGPIETVAFHGDRENGAVQRHKILRGT